MMGRLCNLAFCLVQQSHVVVYTHRVEDRGRDGMAFDRVDVRLIMMKDACFRLCGVWVGVVVVD